MSGSLHLVENKKETTMRKLTVFNSVTLDGYFCGANGDISWAHSNDDAEWNAFTAENAKGDAVLVFGRKTYDMMKSYWPTPEARKNNPEVAEGMNKLPKIVFSRTLDEASWNNTRLIKEDPAAGMRKLKQESGADMVIMGSGSIVSQLARAGLIDEYQIVLVPVVLGQGRTMFESVKEKIPLKRTKTRPFRNGSIVSSYEPAS
jgi:dihydrofolate reductase